MNCRTPEIRFNLEELSYDISRDSPSEDLDIQFAFKLEKPGYSLEHELDYLNDKYGSNADLNTANELERLKKTISGEELEKAGKELDVLKEEFYGNEEEKN